MAFGASLVAGPLAGPRHLPQLEDLQFAHTAMSKGADPVRYRLAPAAPAAAAPPIAAGDDPMPPAEQEPADDIPAALRIAEGPRQFTSCRGPMLKSLP